MLMKEYIPVIKQSIKLIERDVYKTKFEIEKTKKENIPNQLEILDMMQKHLIELLECKAQLQIILNS